MSSAGKRLKKLRLNLGYTQNKFAQMLGVSKTLISKIETEHTPVSPKLFRKITAQFNLSEQWLSQDDITVSEKKIEEQMYELIKYNFRDDTKSAYLINNAIFDIIDTSNMSENEAKAYVSYICNLVTEIASHFRETAAEIRHGIDGCGAALTMCTEDIKGMEDIEHIVDTEDITSYDYENNSKDIKINKKE